MENKNIWLIVAAVVAVIVVVWVYKYKTRVSPSPMPVAPVQQAVRPLVSPQALEQAIRAANPFKGR